MRKFRSIYVVTVHYTYTYMRFTDEQRKQEVTLSL